MTSNEWNKGNNNTMAIRLVRNGGAVLDPAVLDMPASGVVKPNSLVEFSRTGATGVFPATASSSITGILGVCLDYAQGASDVTVKVIPFTGSQLWEVDCVNAASTAQIGLRHVMDDHLNLRNTATDLGAGNPFTAVFRAVAMTGLTTGSGKLIGYFRTSEAPVFTSSTSGGHA